MYTFMVVSSAAVTVTVKVLEPVTRSLFPATTRVASESAASAITSTSAVPYSRFMVPPSTASSPFTANTESVASSLSATRSVSE